MADASKTPNFKYFEWSRPDAAKVTLTSPYRIGDDTLYWSASPKDENGDVIDGGFSVGVRRDDGYTVNFWIPEGAVAADGLSATGVIVQDLAGTDYDTYNADFDSDLSEGSAVFRVVSPVEMQIILNSLQGSIATGGNLFVLGDETNSTVTIFRRNASGNQGLFRWFLTNGKAQFSNDGTNWINFDDMSSSDLVKVSATDTDAGYLLAKVIAGSNIVVTQNNIGGNETLSISTSLPEQITTHAVYTPAFLTTGGSTESNPLVWDSVTDGSFRMSFDGTAYNFDGIDFSAVVTMADVASTIQAAIRAVTGSTETCTWNGTNLIITSADTTVSSAATVTSTSTGTVGTDISGAGAGTFMDGDTGNGTVTNAVLDPTADEGKVVLLNSDGNVDKDFMGDSLAPIVTQYDFAGSPHTWTKPTSNGNTIASLKYVRVQVWGAGGGGGAGTSGGGGGGGGYNEMLIMADDLGATETVTIGEGTTSDGGDTSFGSHIIGYGGIAGGTGSSARGGGGGGALGKGSNSDGGPPDGGDPTLAVGINSTMGGGAGGENVGGSTRDGGNSFYGGGGGGADLGDGGDSYWGGGGGAADGGGSPSNVGGTSVYGGNGGGTDENGSVPGGGGGGGAPARNGGHGRCIVTEFYN